MSIKRITCSRRLVSRVRRFIVEIAKLEKKQMKLNADMKVWEKKLMELQKDFVDYEQGSKAYREPALPAPATRRGCAR